MAASGIVGLIHPESHFTELRANDLRGRRTGGCGGIGSSAMNASCSRRSKTRANTESISTAPIAHYVEFVQALPSIIQIPSPARWSTTESGPAPGVKNDGRQLGFVRRTRDSASFDVDEAQLAALGRAYRRTWHSRRARLG